MAEQRKEQRTPAYLGGRIISDRRRAPVDCIVRNISGAGAKLIVKSTTLLPEEFDLHIPKQDRECRVRARWRGAKEIGVEIAPAPQDIGGVIPLTLAKRLRQLEAENAILKKHLEE